MADNFEQLLERYKRALDEAGSRELVFLLVGKCGMGKSSTVNSLMGEEVAPVGDYEPTTMEVKSYKSKVSGVQFAVIDTPGLCDDLEEKGNDQEYLNRIKSFASQVDLVWFVTRLDDTRITSDGKRGRKLISEALGARVWNHSLIIFTFAGNVTSDRYHAALTKRGQPIREVIGKYSDERTADAIPAVAVDNKCPKTPDGREWLGELFTKVVVRLSDKGTAPFLLMMAKDVYVRSKMPTPSRPPDPSTHVQWPHVDEKPRINLYREQKREMLKKIDAAIIPTMALGGGAIGSVFGPAGTAIGGAVGAAVGLVAWLWK
jgi:hypothetical protein